MNNKFTKKFLAIILAISMLLPNTGASLAKNNTKKSPLMNYDDTSNIGAEREVIIKGGTSDRMVVKDNGIMRKELSSTDLADGYMGLGINLGNTMEAVLSSLAAKAAATEATQFETAWGAAITTQKYIDCVHSYGINTLRIPVAWSNMVNEETYEINEKYLGRVEEIVNYALNDGMYAIINIHWDNQWWGQFGACKRVSETDITRIPDEEKRAKAWIRFESYWKQISERFKDYSDHLIFEGANEELGSRLNDSIYASGYAQQLDESDDDMIGGNLKKDELYDMTNRINQKFVDVVRASGGNNKYRHLLIPGYGTDISNTVDERYKMPADIEENGKSKLFVSVHCYSPWNFCGYEATGGYTVADKTALAKELGMMKRFSDEGYAIILGECGICNPAGVKGDVCQWFKDCFEEARKWNMVPVMWESGQYFDRSEAKLKFKDVAETWNSITGANGDTSMTKLTGKKNTLAIEMTEIEKTQKPVWSWIGKWYKNGGGDTTIGDDRYVEGGGTIVSSTETDPKSKFVPSSQTTATIEGDATEIFFNDWGYRTFLKIDLSKYKKPALLFEFMDGTATEENVGTLRLGATSEADKYAGDFSIDYWDFNGKAVMLSDNIGLSAEKPWLCVTFDGMPTVTAIHIYELDGLTSKATSEPPTEKPLPTITPTITPTVGPSNTPAVSQMPTSSPQSSPAPSVSPTAGISIMPSATPAVRKQMQYIIANSYVKTYGSKPFYLNAKTSGNGRLSYGGVNKKVAVVNQSGKVLTKGYGQTTITIMASGTDAYYSAVKKISITVIPKKASISKLISKKKGRIICKVKKQKKVSGYEFLITDSRGIQKMIKNKKTNFKARYISKRKYWLKVRAYKKIGKKVYRGAWSKKRVVKTK